MPKIRDLGINVIPATMRPPEIGAGGALEIVQACGPQTKPMPCFAASGRPPKPGPGPGPKPKPKVNAYGYHLAEDAVVQLRQQLHDALENEIVN